MRTSRLVPAFLALLLACGLSFGAGYFVALQQVEPPRLELVSHEAPPGQPLPQPAATPKPEVEPKAHEPIEIAVAPQEPPTQTTQPGPTASAAGTLEAEIENAYENPEERVMPVLELGEATEMTATIIGTVVDSFGAPVEGAGIYGNYTESMQAGNSGMRVTVSGARSGPGGEPLATSGPGGDFRIDVSRRVRQGASVSVGLTAIKDGHAASATQSVRIAQGETRDGVRLALRQSGTVSGRVVDEGGRGVAGVEVSLVAGESRMYFDAFTGTARGPSTTTNAGGEYRIEGVPEGRHSFRLSATGYRQISGPSSVDVRPGVDTRAAADFVLASATGVRATLRNTDGNPLRGWATLQFKDVSGSIVTTLRGMLAEDGVFSANDAPVGSFTVNIVLHGHEAQDVHATVLEGYVADLGVVILRPTD